MYPELLFIKGVLDSRGVVWYTADITKSIATFIRFILKAGGTIVDIVRIVQRVRICWSMSVKLAKGQK